MNTANLSMFFEDDVVQKLFNERFDGNESSSSIEKFNDLSDELLSIIVDLYEEENKDNIEKLKKFSVLEIINYLQITHKYYLTKKLPEIEQSLLHVFSKYKETDKLLSALILFFNNYKEKLIKHIRMEEKDFFPFIKQLNSLKNSDLTEYERQIFLDNNYLAKFNDDHDPIEDELTEVKKIIEENISDKEIPLPFRVFLNQVGLFELELRKHALIEDHVLVPLVASMEKDIKSNI